MSQLLNSLIAARAKITFGWCQHKLCEFDLRGTPTAYCARGAVDAVVLGGLPRPATIKAVDEALAMAIRCIEPALYESTSTRTKVTEQMYNLTPDAIRSITNANVVVDYNNTKGRTQIEMLALFDLAIATERAKTQDRPLPASITDCLQIVTEEKTACHSCSIT